jgi:hypothetical protein
VIPLQISGVFAPKAALKKRMAGGTAEGFPFVPMMGWKDFIFYTTF